ncbi:MAG: hypothetical protein VXW87_00150 [Pseudomonadota bacterium]|nr:hypothetical protein [Pseudomonadota bacterium]
MTYIHDIISQAVDACNVSLYGMENTHEGLVVYIEKSDGDITIKDCEAVMKQINYSTDTDDLHVEVSSKGVYPPLFNQSHYQEAINKMVKIRTEGKSYKGILRSADSQELILEKGDHTFTIATTSVKTARLVPVPTGE